MAQYHGSVDRADEPAADRTTHRCRDPCDSSRAAGRPSGWGPPFLSTLLRNPAHRRELLRQGWKDVGKVFLLAAILDVIYQLIVHREVYLLELLLTAVTLAVVPYVLLRGPVSRIARLVFDARPA